MKRRKPQLYRRKPQPMQPIRDADMLEQFKKVLESWSLRNWFLFFLGINSGLRISDLVPLRVSDLMGSHLVLREQKTQKAKRLKINAWVRENFEYYVRSENLSPNDYLFPSQKGGHISKDRAYRIMRIAAAALDLDAIGTHTMRKTFGYQYYERTKDIATLQILFNHSSQRVTLRYIGKDQDRLDEAMDSVRL